MEQLDARREQRAGRKKSTELGKRRDRDRKGNLSRCGEGTSAKRCDTWHLHHKQQREDNNLGQKALRRRVRKRKR